MILLLCEAGVILSPLLGNTWAVLIVWCMWTVLTVSCWRRFAFVLGSGLFLLFCSVLFAFIMLDLLSLCKPRDWLGEIFPNWPICVHWDVKPYLGLFSVGVIARHWIVLHCVQPKEAVVTRWRADPWSRGSYSYVAAGSSGLSVLLALWLYFAWLAFINRSSMIGGTTVNCWPGNVMELVIG